MKNAPTLEPNTQGAGLDAARALLHALRTRGLTLKPSGRGTILISPRNQVDAETTQRVIEAKATILKILKANSGIHTRFRCNRFAFPRPTTCYWCRTQEARDA